MSLALCLLAFGILAPAAFFLWREHRLASPAARWPKLAGHLNFQYQGPPPSLRGSWKEREVVLEAVEGGAVLSIRMRESGAFRVEVGPREAAEKASGLVVPDRVPVADAALDALFLVRAQPPDAGRFVDISVLRKLQRFPGAWALAVPGRVEVRLASPPVEAAQVRDAADAAVSLADALEAD